MVSVLIEVLCSWGSLITKDCCVQDSSFKFQSNSDISRINFVMTARMLEKSMDKKKNSTLMTNYEFLLLNNSF